MILPAVTWAPMMACSDSDCEFVMVKYYVITQERKEEFIFPKFLRCADCIQLLQG